MLETAGSIVRWLAAALFIGFGTLILFSKRATGQGFLFRLVQGCFSGIAVSLGLGLVMLDWRWLLAAAVILGLGASILIGVRFKNGRKFVQALKQLAAKTRTAPLTKAEIRQRMAMDEVTAIALAMEEQRTGRDLSLEEAAALAAQLENDFAGDEAKRAAEVEKMQLEMELEATEERKMAEDLAEEMRTGQASPRLLRATLDKDLIFRDQENEIRALPAGLHELVVSITLSRPDDDSGYPDVEVCIQKHGSSAIRRVVNLSSLANLTEVKSASWWRAKPEGWRKAFSENVLLSAEECVEDEKEWVEFPVDGELLAFYSRSSGKFVTLACPGLDGVIWCRVHGLSHLEVREESSHEGEWIHTPPFYFAISLNDLLTKGEEAE